MAITLYGVDPSITELEWAKIGAITGRGNYDEVVDTGLVVSVATGNRIVSVTSGRAVAANVYANSTASESVTLDTNSSGNPRIDYIVLEIDWSLTAATGGDVKFVKGTPGATPSAPNLTRNAGVLWQIPLARVTVANGAGQLVAGNIEACAPGYRLPRENSYSLSGSFGSSAADATLQSVPIADPGWPYMLYVSAQTSFNPTASGHGRIDVTVNGGSLGSASASPGNDADAVMASRATGVLTGASTLRISVTAISVPAGGLTANGGRLNYLLIPA